MPNPGQIRGKEDLVRYRLLWGAAAVVVGPLLALGSGPASASTSRTTSAPAPAITEYYDGHTYALTPTNWHGAKDCAVVSPTVLACFDTAAEMGGYTSGQTAKVEQSDALTSDPVATPFVSCSGWTKIWNGANWTGTGLAFHDWGYPQNLNSYTPTPFHLISWFSDGQRGYAANNCNGNAFAGNNGTGNYIGLPKNAESKNRGTAWLTDSIELYHP
jgi:hypothetical protein